MGFQNVLIIVPTYTCFVSYFYSNFCVVYIKYLCREYVVRVLTYIYVCMYVAAIH